ncbi:MAG: Coenzyme F420 hydrogenase/dehydrogenase, beta subunit C-terminal domain [Paludibacteraceae bacterium]|nr:Coenzyme F420 hydrogenase/dehydrogenase, beta subunit C-terminal domain [Paludibacteraceae bacterium]
MNKRYPILATKKNCTGCMACVDACPSGALCQFINDEGHYTFKLDKEICVNCLKCESTCPIVSKIDYGNNDLSTPVYAAWSCNKELRKKSSSGGAATAISEYILKQGGVVIGATLDGSNCRHISIESISDLPKLQGSKYMQSDACGAYKQTLQYLREGRRVLFIGTPCQVAAAINFVKNPKLSENLFSLDMVCGGVPSLFIRDRFISESGKKIKAIDSFRNKDKGWKSKGFTYQLKVVNDRNEIEVIHEKNLLLDGFVSELTNRYSCYDCQFVYINRKSDFTIADFWGDTFFRDEHKEGLSSLAVHTEKGKVLLAEIKNQNIKIKQTSWDKVLPYNFRYVYGHSLLKHLPQRKYLNWIFNHCLYETLCSFYAGDVTFKKPIGIVLKVMRKITIIINRKKSEKFIYNLLNK